MYTNNMIRVTCDERHSIFTRRWIYLMVVNWTAYFLGHRLRQYVRNLIHYDCTGSLFINKIFGSTLDI